MEISAFLTRRAVCVQCEETRRASFCSSAIQNVKLSHIMTDLLSMLQALPQLSRPVRRVHNGPPPPRIQLLEATSLASSGTRFQGMGKIARMSDQVFACSLKHVHGTGSFLRCLHIDTWLVIRSVGCSKPGNGALISFGAAFPHFLGSLACGVGRGWVWFVSRGQS